MSTAMVPLAALSPLHRRELRSEHNDSSLVRRRLILWVGGLVFAAALYLSISAFWAWKHPIASSGGRYFVHRIVIPIPAFQQSDPRWTFELLGPTIDTMGQAGCAVTSAAMVLAGYGVDLDPQRLNQYLTTHQGYTPQGWIYWEKAAELANGRVEKVYEDLPSYALIDQNLREGNPVIVRLTLRSGTTHFVVIVGKEGWDYLTQDPARPATWGVYPLKNLTSRIEGLRFYRLLPPSPPSLLTQAATPSISPLLK